MQKLLSIPGIETFAIFEIGFSRDFVQNNGAVEYLGSGQIHLSLNLPDQTDQYNFLNQWYKDWAKTKNDNHKKTVNYTVVESGNTLEDFDYFDVLPTEFHLQNIQDENEEIVGQKVLVLFNYQNRVNLLPVEELEEPEGLNDVNQT